MICIFAPFGLAFGLFVVYLIVAIFLKDPARPFGMFKAPALGGSPESRGGLEDGDKEEEKFEV
jgi:hypothetical protein